MPDQRKAAHHDATQHREQIQALLRQAIAMAKEDGGRTSNSATCVGLFIEVAGLMQEAGMKRSTVATAIASAAGTLAHLDITDGNAKPIEEWQVGLVQEHVARSMREAELDRRSPN